MKESFVARDMARGHKLFGQESVALNCDTLLWRGGSKGVNGIGPWGQKAKPPEPRGGFHYPQIAAALLRSGPWSWEHDLPDPWGAVAGIDRKQFVQKGRTTPRHSGDKNRSRD